MAASARTPLILLNPHGNMLALPARLNGAYVPSQLAHRMAHGTREFAACHFDNSLLTGRQRTSA